MEKTAYKLILSLAVFSGAIPLLAYLVRFRIQPKQNHILGALVILSAVCDGIRYIRVDQKFSNVLLFNLYDIGQFILLGWFFYEIMFRHTNSNVLQIGTAAYVLSFLLSILFLQGLFEYQGLLWAAASAIIITFTISFYNYVGGWPTRIVFNPFLTSELHVNGGIFINCTLNFALFAMVNYIVTELDTSMASLCWSFQNLSTVIRNIFFAAGLYFVDQRNPQAGYMETPTTPIKIKI